GRSAVGTHAHGALVEGDGAAHVVQVGALGGDVADHGAEVELQRREVEDAAAAGGLVLVGVVGGHRAVGDRRVRAAGVVDAAGGGVGAWVGVVAGRGAGAARRRPGVEDAAAAGAAGGGVVIGGVAGQGAGADRQHPADVVVDAAAAELAAVGVV